MNEDGSVKNPFIDKSFDVAYKEYKARNSERIEKQRARKAKKEEKLAEEEERKRKRALNARRRSWVKRRRDDNVEVTRIWMFK